MAPASKADRKAALDVAAWTFNIVTSVGIIMVNKALMATHRFTFGKSIINSFYGQYYFVTVFNVSLI